MIICIAQILPPLILNCWHNNPTKCTIQISVFEGGNGYWWWPCNHERKLLIGPEHNFHWLHWHTFYSLVGKYGLKNCGILCNLVWFLIRDSEGNSWCPFKEYFYLRIIFLNPMSRPLATLVIFAQSFVGQGMHWET